jgi:hypothetical protein
MHRRCTRCSRTGRGRGTRRSSRSRRSSSPPAHAGLACGGVRVARSAAETFVQRTLVVIDERIAVVRAALLVARAVAHDDLAVAVALCGEGGPVRAERRHTRPCAALVAHTLRGKRAVSDVGALGLSARTAASCRLSARATAAASRSGRAARAGARGAVPAAAFAVARIGPRASDERQTEHEEARDRGEAGQPRRGGLRRGAHFPMGISPLHSIFSNCLRQP